MIYDVSHRTTITYDGIVRLAEFNIRMRPADWPDQSLISERLDLAPQAEIVDRAGAFLSPVTRARIDAPLKDLVIRSRFRIRVDRPTPEPSPDDPSVAQAAASALTAMRLDALAPANYLYPSPHVPLEPDVVAWCAPELAPERGVVEAALALARRIKASFRYDPNATETDTPLAEAFAAKHGVCQDFAQIMLAGLRGAGLAAAYVSGYLRTLPPPGKPRLVGADATHAWVLVWCGDAMGWVGFDPTNGCTVGSDHILIGVGRDYSDVSPVDGILLGLTDQTLKVAVDVIPLAGEPG